MIETALCHSASMPQGSAKVSNLNETLTVVASLLELRGVGRWTAEYVLLRGLKPLDVFPGDDVGARNRLAKWLQRNEPLDYDGVARVTRNWEPYAGVVYFHMLLEGLCEAGELK
jgi:DNA-3-methyladenine glycosylase II